MKMCLHQLRCDSRLARLFVSQLSLKPLLIMELGHQNVVTFTAGNVYLTVSLRLPLAPAKLAWKE